MKLYVFAMFIIIKNNNTFICQILIKVISLFANIQFTFHQFDIIVRLFTLTTNLFENCFVKV